MDNALKTKDLEDAELVRLSLADPDKFSLVIGRYQEKLSRYVRRLGASSPEDAEDILQDIFLKIYLNLNDFNPDLKFSSWVYRIAHNQVISHFRKRQVRPEAHSLPIDSPGFQLLADDISLDKQSDINLRQAAITEALNKLDARYREILILKFFEDKSYQEISDILKKPAGTVASLLNRAKKSLKNSLPAKMAEL
ncbi:MAG: RNA polymerase sigma factor [Patescibacteria group bacterium]|nr:RNA polymerase sigma factor [Patescibacteria group bacterium]